MGAQVKTGEGIDVPANLLMSKNGWCHQQRQMAKLGGGDANGTGTDGQPLTLTFAFPVPKVGTGQIKWKLTQNKDCIENNFPLLQFCPDH